MTEIVSPRLVEYAQHHGIDLPSPFSGRLVVVVDDKYRVSIHVSNSSNEVLRYRLAALPSAGSQRDGVLLKVGTFAASMLSAHRASCVVDSREFSLWLQQVVQPEVSESLDESMASFVSAISIWVAELPRLA